MTNSKRRECVPDQQAMFAVSTVVVASNLPVKATSDRERMRDVGFHLISKPSRIETVELIN